MADDETDETDETKIQRSGLLSSRPRNGLSRRQLRRDHDKIQKDSYSDFADDFPLFLFLVFSVVCLARPYAEPLDLADQVAPHREYGNFEPQVMICDTVCFILFPLLRRLW